MNKDVLQAQINLSIARSNWWIAYANTPGNLNRDVYRGFSEVRYTKEQLIDDAMQTANNHLRLAQEALDALNTLG